jgi:hypothetical protein
VGAFQTNGIFTHLLDESSIFYSEVCDIYMLGFDVSDDEEINIETIISIGNRSGDDVYINRECKQGNHNDCEGAGNRTGYD